ncbi:FecR family protein [Sphingobacterium chuzhouense]|uniref:FecR domain-containing protein n=1 Tax=Sphingobacterium chuzhouense TaxID=1742264 RepID=A0ABR7XW48_9SPHI|nr:FecR domain-containing protein [Sphingobacterium chuzhouense]MBD1423281.1 FecR domain-containing protein [Sphingobacterium chuzhouense]
MDRQALHNLLTKYRAGKLTDEEIRVLKDFLNTPTGQDLVSELWDKDLEIVPFHDDTTRQDSIFRRIMADGRVADTSDVQQEVIHHPRRLWTKVAIAASILLAATASGVLFLMKHKSPENEVLRVHKQEIQPGSDKARIVFDDGSFIELDEVEDGTVLENKGVRIVKRDDGTIAYELGDNQKMQKPIYNTIVTPRGGEYSIMLPDGSRVWMNAASKLKYPVAFATDTREVELEGEAYFEVVNKNTKTGKRIPFIVHTHEQQLEVLGTSFNINSYNQNITTTLVEGAVALTYPHTRKVQYLKPSQQSNYSQKDKKLSVVKVDPYYTIAWKDGSFAFQNASIYEVMDDIARWYNIEVVYEGDLSDVRYSGTISRFENFRQLLQIIEWTDLVTFKVDGRRITVMK